MVTVVSLSGSHVHSLPAFLGLNLLCKPVCLRLRMGKSVYCEDTAMKTLPPPSAQQLRVEDKMAWLEIMRNGLLRASPPHYTRQTLLLRGFSLQAKPQICMLCFHSGDRSPPLYPSTTIRRDFPDFTCRAISSSRLSTCYQEVNYFLQ